MRYKKTKRKVVCAGRIVFDIIFSGKKSENLLKSSPRLFRELDNAIFHIGGSAANTAVWLRALDANLLLIACIGNDYFGKIIKNHPSIKQIPRKLYVCGPQTSISIVVSSTSAEPRYFHTQGANTYLSPEHIVPHLSHGDILFIAGLPLLKSLCGEEFIKFLGSLTDKNVTIVFGGCHGGSMKSFAKNIGFANYVLINSDEAHRLKRSLKLKSLKHLSLNGPTIVQTMGSAGCVVYSDGIEHFHEGMKINPVDKCGAGDAFAAGLLYGLTEQLPLSSSIEFGIKMGTECCRTIGGSTPPIDLKNKIISLS